MPWLLHSWGQAVGCWKRAHSTETGSGVPLAARGRHFATDTAIGSIVEKGAVVAGFDPRTTIVEIPLNDSDGLMRSIAATDNDCDQAVARSLAEGGKVLLHILDVSKRGRAAPSLDGVKAICDRYGEAVGVVVDACQARLSSDAVRTYVEAGWLVLVTGSKFFTGPPFSGALLVPIRCSDDWNVNRFLRDCAIIQA